MSARRDQIISSALWATYGDALGFPTEMATEAQVSQRLGVNYSSSLNVWKKLVGGKFGISAVMPRGAYSDDTQLRLAASRAIRGDGFFDVESFAKVELPVWLSYALGAGKGCKTAAKSLSGRNVNWFSNFFSGYTGGGGNGAAMRIQPHVWAATDLVNAQSFLPDVIRNSICTHGHLRGIVGAVIHALCLAYTLREGQVPSPSVWFNLASEIERLPEIFETDSDLSTFWLPTWESKNKVTLQHAVFEVAKEWKEAVEIAVSTMSGDHDNAYEDLVNKLGGLTDAERGSGLKCALFANAAAWLFRLQLPESAIKTVANLLNSDTDTIGTMTGALMGAVKGQAPPVEEVQDAEYITMEANRLFDISQNIKTISFEYPDLLYWGPPKNSLEAVVEEYGEYSICGLGKLHPKDLELSGRQTGVVWQWYKLEFGQSIFCRRRKNSEIYSFEVANRDGKYDAEQMELNYVEPQPLPVQSIDFSMAKKGGGTLDEITDAAIKSNFDPMTIGLHFIELASEDNGLELAIAYASIIVKAKRSRVRRNG